MILDAGEGKFSSWCICGQKHHDVSIGEEALICVCGRLLTFEEREHEFEYMWVSRHLCQKNVEQAYNSDTRNLN